MVLRIPICAGRWLLVELHGLRGARGLHSRGLHRLCVCFGGRPRGHLSLRSPRWTTGARLESSSGLERRLGFGVARAFAVTTPSAWRMACEHRAVKPEVGRQKAETPARRARMTPAVRPRWEGSTGSAQPAPSERGLLLRYLLPPHGSAYGNLSRAARTLETAWTQPLAQWAHGIRSSDVSEGRCKGGGSASRAERRGDVLTGGTWSGSTRSAGSGRARFAAGSSYRRAPTGGKLCRTPLLEGMYFGASDIPPGLALGERHSSAKQSSWSGKNLVELMFDV